MSSSSIKMIKEKNKKTILGLIYKNSPIARVDVAKKSGISKVTVTRIVNELLSEGIIEESGVDVSTGGRPPVFLKIVPSSRFLFGVDIGAYSMRIGLFDITRKLIAMKSFDYGEAVSGDEVAGNIIQTMREMSSEKNIPLKKIIGAGISVSGIIDYNKGTVLKSYLFKEKHYPLLKKLREHFEFNIVIDNDANVGLVYESWMGKGYDIKNIIFILTRNYVAKDMGLGVGFLFDGGVYRGFGYCAGEVGVASSKSDAGIGSISCDPFSSYEAIPSVEVLAKDILAGRKQNEQTEFYRDLSFDGVIKAGLNGDTLALDIIGALAKSMAPGIGFLVNLLNPEIVVIGGDLAHCGKSFIELINREVIKYIFEMHRVNLKIEISSFTEDDSGIQAASFLGLKSLIDI
ncbi:MAG: ROK family transcriptional regulator [Candidatus Aureabacteria bacterium]|nr:ROK family transcriptional regulator [Candidatus Auribacterota bacterium]